MHVEAYTEYLSQSTGNLVFMGGGQQVELQMGGGQVAHGLASVASYGGGLVRATLMHQPCM